MICSSKNIIPFYSGSRRIFEQLKTIYIMLFCLFFFISLKFFCVQCIFFITIFFSFPLLICVLFVCLFFLITNVVYMDLFDCFSSVLMGWSTVIGHLFFFHCRIDIDFLFTLTDLKNSRSLLINF